MEERNTTLKIRLCYCLPSLALYICASRPFQRETISCYFSKVLLFLAYHASNIGLTSSSRVAGRSWREMVVDRTNNCKRGKYVMDDTHKCMQALRPQEIPTWERILFGCIILIIASISLVLNILLAIIASTNPIFDKSLHLRLQQLQSVPLVLADSSIYFFRAKFRYIFCNIYENYAVDDEDIDAYILTNKAERSKIGYSFPTDLCGTIHRKHMFLFLAKFDART
ncbi:unnamed protein product [Cylicocyclus nassatus]|uniref:Uncharacterized protein n=1 Tax=Cylicocyclus nassatus TaxID=53992 RepID=A0AA36HD09_CYLNA|nr:unnamed protein product [Cylicocyclus nassatus]